ncbi:unnamed protein product [Effrenium voratum]|nr:unnamed protein product [Effrenium voratum]
MGSWLGSGAAAWRRGLELLAAMPARRQLPNVVSFSAASSSLRWQLAVRLLSEASRAVRVNVISFNTALAAGGEAGRWREAEQLSAQLRWRGLQGDLVTANSAAFACEKVGQWRQAVHRHGGDTIGFNSAISACQKGAQWRRAWQLFGAVAAPSVVTCGAAANFAAAEASAWRWALRPAGRHLSLRPGLITLSAAIAACAATAALWARAARLFAQLREVPLAPDEEAFNALRGAKCKPWRLSSQFFITMLDARIPMDAIGCNVAIAACEKGGRPSDILTATGPMRESDAFQLCPSCSSLGGFSHCNQKP